MSGYRIVLRDGNLKGEGTKKKKGVFDTGILKDFLDGSGVLRKASLL